MLSWKAEDKTSKEKYNIRYTWNIETEQPKKPSSHDLSPKYSETLSKSAVAILKKTHRLTKFNFTLILVYTNRKKIDFFYKYFIKSM